MKTLIAILLLPCLAYGAPTDAADQAFAKGEYQAALDGYAAAAKTPGETGLKALYRAVESEALLLRYGEAAQRLSGLKLPSDPLWRARFLLLRAETGR